MQAARSHRERHVLDRVGWLRAAVLGANDGILSTASLVVGVAASGASSAAVLVAGLAGLVAGAMSMAAGEYVSVSSQADAEGADLERERQELLTQPEFELTELAMIYEGRGLSPALARQVATELMAHDALGAHARDELGLTEISTARPLTAALASAATFAVGAASPLIAAIVSPPELVMWSVPAVTLVALAALGALGGAAGGAGLVRPAVRVVFWGAIAMAATAVIGTLFGVSA